MRLALSALLTAQRLDALLLRLYGPELMLAQRPVLVSQWSKYYFMQVWPWLLGERATGFEQTLVALDERGLPVALASSEKSVELALEAALEDHLRPVIKALAAYGKVAPVVLWGNAGDCLDQCLGGLPAPQRLAAQRLLSTPGSPVFDAVGLRDDGRKVRRTCCLSYKVAWVGHCEHCPLLD